jgi:hypothetical protein
MNVFLKKGISKVLRKVGHLYDFVRTQYHKDDDYLWLSLGENCLSDSILQRSYLKSYSSIYGSARSNIDYAIQMQNQNHRGLLDKDHTVYEVLNGSNVLRSSLYNESDDIFHGLHRNGFEFTHHDWVEKKEFVKTFERRISRTQENIGDKNFVFLYHHRHTEKSDIQLLTKKLNEFKSIFEVNNKRCYVILFYQNIVSDSSEREISMKNEDNGVIEFILHTQNTWEGDDQDIFWARNDDDLIKEMIKKSKRIIHKKKS